MMQTPLSLPARPLPPAPSPLPRPQAIQAGSRGIWKDTRGKPLSA